MNLANNLLRNYKEIPKKICLIEEHEKVTYEDLYIRVAKFKKYLEDKGIKKGDKILVLVPMSIDLYVTLLSLWSMGATACFMDAGFIKNGMKKNKFNEVDGIVGITKFLLYSNINKNLSRLKIKINVSVIKKLKDSTKLEVTEVEEEFPAILTYTSGTTGVPKIAARSHKFLEIQANILQENLNYEKGDVELSSIPIFTLCNIDIGITTVIANGKYTNLGKSDEKKLIRQIDEDCVNRLMEAPALLNKITQYYIKNNIKNKSITKIFTGGGAVFIDFIEDMKSAFPNAKIITLYGSTEAEPIAKLNIDDMTADDIEATKNGNGILAGDIVGVTDCKIIKCDKPEIGELTKDEFESLQTNKVGEIVVAGENVLKGYINGIGDKENKFTVDGVKYHRTGDLGYIDENNKLWLRGRAKDPYFNIEAALHANFKIGKTAVFKSNDRIILVLEESSAVDEEELRKAVSFEHIDKVVYVKEIPVDKRHSTKVDYKELKKKLKME